MRFDTREYIFLKGFLFILILFFTSCNNGDRENTINPANQYPEMIGDFNLLDQLDSSFMLCEIIVNTVGTNQNEFSTFRDKMFRNYSSIKKIGETGFVTIRFMVNCNGETKMFKVQGMNNLLQEREFDERITKELVRLTRESKGWERINFNGSYAGYNQYLTFNIVDSELIEIAP